MFPPSSLDDEDLVERSIGLRLAPSSGEYGAFFFRLDTTCLPKFSHRGFCHGREGLGHCGESLFSVSLLPYPLNQCQKESATNRRVLRGFPIRNKLREGLPAMHPQPQTRGSSVQGDGLAGIWNWSLEHEIPNIMQRRSREP